MLRTSSDRVFWYDTSPDYQEYLNTPWSETFAPIMESMQEMIEAFKPAVPMFDSIVKKPIHTISHHYAPAYSMIVDEAGKVWAGFDYGGLIPQIQTVFTEDLTGIEDGSGPGTHDDRGRPILDRSGGVPRPVQPFTRCPHGDIVARCRRCRR